ncbi:MAG TPA: HEAT repeat domain-containing protein [Bryobacteraceae bacterium]|nr:HEAT repeat domain-containing protein [Bryobacteraceae bacterium]
MNTTWRWAAVIAMLTGFAATGRAATVSPEPGDQRTWKLDFRVRLEQPDGKSPDEVRLSGELTVTISATRFGEYDAAAEITGAHVTGNAATSVPPGAADELGRRIGRRFWGTWRNDGTLVAVHFYKDVSASDCNLLQMILTETQFVRPTSAEHSWTTLERDAAGSYLAIYQQAESNVVVKRKLKYVETSGVAGAPAGALRVLLDKSEVRFALDNEGRVAGLDGSDRVKFGLPVDKVEPLIASMEVHLGSPRQIRAPSLIGSLAAALPEVRSLPVVTHALDPEPARNQRDAELLNGRTTESLLEAAFSGNSDASLRDRLTALFRQRPEAAAAALALLRKRGPDGRLTDALGGSGSRAAAETLTVLARDPSASTALRVDGLTGLALTQHPSAESMRVTVDLLEDADARVASAARILAGALARAGRAEHPKEADAIDAVLIERYRKTVDEKELADLLGGLGNSASAAAGEVIEAALHDSRVPVRAVAVRALRLTRGPEVDGLLSTALATDSDPSVRADAIFAAGFRHSLDSALTEAVLRAARTDPAESVRSSAVTLLARAPHASPQIRETLAWVAENDAKFGIRRQARQALELGK